MTEYVVLLMGDAERWWDLTEEERRAGYAAHEEFSARLVAGGHRITGGAELHRASEARTIPPGTTTVTDGPWAETTEQVGGFYLVETDDLDGLMDCCVLLAATGDAVEVRRCVTPQERAS
ncbi:hypothetical protein GCM10011376_30650 [Nocardioides flavus (ex Wang et al. 2016)]|uniref:YCII-related domain-containing protein n=1 Tax=Nocardioides flavus (ex Wang et al. 2016) TaxID=2058780 RepID=A0ABQ3HLB0_9ACTN|nr:YciI family protein [Nocardioides flavus (ex Wang et al. 2016)]GHE18455.1 hypothetical protein GCM10011376_30650 [Nocardioides flavus (ex Wang et al. 2016)]